MNKTRNQRPDNNNLIVNTEHNNLIVTQNSFNSDLFTAVMSRIQSDTQLYRQSCSKLFPCSGMFQVQFSDHRFRFIRNKVCPIIHRF